MTTRIDPIGKTFGRLRVIGITRRKRHRDCVCLCTCGNVKTIRYGSLTSGDTQSCGCLLRETVASRFRKHGDAAGVKPSREWVCWRGMRQRCEDANSTSFPHYGARGIQVCDRWQVFENFLADMGRKPSPDMQIERVDNDGNYEPSNCRWASRSEQAKNRSERARLSNGTFAPRMGEEVNAA